MTGSTRSARALVAAFCAAPFVLSLVGGAARGQTATDDQAAQPAASAAPAGSAGVRGHSFGELDDRELRRRLTQDAQPQGRTAGGGVPRGGRAVHRAVTADVPVATLPGFENLGDGGSRVFVRVSKAVQVEERRQPGQLVYVLKGAHVNKRNNTNPLVTVHWNTPVASARLVPSGADVHLVVQLRAAAAPSWRVAEAQPGAALQVDFPAGTYVHGPAPAPVADAQPETIDGTSADEPESAQPARDTVPPPRPLRGRGKARGRGELGAPAGAPPIPR